jgi:hypothetical protein
MYESAVNDNAEDFPKVAVDGYPTVVIVVKFLSTFVDWGSTVYYFITDLNPESLRVFTV